MVKNEEEDPRVDVPGSHATVPDTASANETKGATAPLDCGDDYYDVDEDGYRTPWCRNFEGHRDGHEFCDHHQISWCRLCDRECPACVDDPRCPDCGCALFEEYHDWDCCYTDEDE